MSPGLNLTGVIGPGRRSVLRTYPALRVLVTARAVSFVGDGITTTVLVLLAAGRDGPYGVSVLLLASALPRLAGPLAGVVADRTDARVLMAACELASAAVIGVIAVTLPPLPLLAVLVVASAVLATVRNPAGRGVVPAVVAPADRGPANALLGIGLTLQVAVGPAVGGLLAAGPGGVRTALAVDALTFVVAATLLLRLPALPPARDPVEIGGVWAEAAAGVRHVATHRRIRLLVVSLAALVAVASVDNVALVFLAGDALDAGPAGFGVAASAFGVGMLVAATACTRLARTRAPETLIVGAVVATGAGTLVTGLAPMLAVVVAAQAVAGAGNAVENIGYDTAVQATVPRALLGRVFGILGTAAQLGASLATAAGGVLVALAGPRAVFVGSGVATSAVAVGLAVTLGRKAG
jgi:MFS family permease